MKIVHISPTYFDSSSIIGGGERFPSELALWLSKIAPTTLLSFSNQNKTYSIGSLQVEIMKAHGFFRGQKVNPKVFPPLKLLMSADVIHIHHFATMISDLSAIVGRLFGKKVFVTNHGGGGSLTLSRFFPTEKLYHGAVVYSEFGLQQLTPRLLSRALLIPGGVDLERFRPNESVSRANRILCVARIVPHKGIHLVIQAFKKIAKSGEELLIAGQPYHPEYYQVLKQMAEGAAVRFEHGFSDEELIAQYQSAKATVLASSYLGFYGDKIHMPELMGFAILESQACGTPAICANVGGMPEYVKHEKTGFICRDQSIEDLAHAFRAVLDMDSNSYRQMSVAARQWTETQGWDRVAQSHLEMYSR